MTLQLYALAAVGIAIGVICINVAMLAVVSTDVMIWKADRQKIAQRYTYWLCLEIAAFCFAAWWFAG